MATLTQRYQDPDEIGRHQGLTLAFLTTLF
jgi:hypothetical protein